MYRTAFSSMLAFCLLLAFPVNKTFADDEYKLPNKQSFPEFKGLFEQFKENHPDRIGELLNYNVVDDKFTPFREDLGLKSRKVVWVGDSLFQEEDRLNASAGTIRTMLKKTDKEIPNIYVPTYAYTHHVAAMTDGRAIPGQTSILFYGTPPTKHDNFSGVGTNATPSPSYLEGRGGVLIDRKIKEKVENGTLEGWKGGLGKMYYKSIFKSAILEQGYTSATPFVVEYTKEQFDNAKKNLELLMGVGKKPKRPSNYGIRKGMLEILDQNGVEAYYKKYGKIFTIDDPNFKFQYDSNKRYVQFNGIVHETLYTLKKDGTYAHQEGDDLTLNLNFGANDMFSYIAHCFDGKAIEDFDNEPLTADQMKEFTGMTIAEIHAMKTPKDFFANPNNKLAKLAEKILLSNEFSIRYAFESNKVKNIIDWPMFPMSISPGFLKGSTPGDANGFLHIVSLFEKSMNYKKKIYAERLSNEFANQGYKVIYPYAKTDFNGNALPEDQQIDLYNLIISVMTDKENYGFHQDVVSVMDLFLKAQGKNPNDLDVDMKLRDELKNILMSILRNDNGFYDHVHPTSKAYRLIAVMLWRLCYQNEDLRNAMFDFQQGDEQKFIASHKAFKNTVGEITAYYVQLRNDIAANRLYQDMMDKGLVKNYFTFINEFGFAETSAVQTNGWYFFGNAGEKLSNWRMRLAETNQDEDFQLGATYFKDDYAFGFVAHKNKHKFAESDGNVSQEDFAFTSYVGFKQDGLNINANATYSTGNRTSLNENASQWGLEKYNVRDARNMSMNLNASYEQDLTHGFYLKPSATMNYHQYHLSGYSEAKDRNYEFSDVNIDSSYLYAGLELGFNTEFEKYNLNILAGANYFYNLSHDSATSFVGVDGYRLSYELPSLGNGKQFYAEAIVETFNKAASLHLHYEAMMFDHMPIEHDVLGELQYQF